MRGRKPKPTAQKRLDGNPGRRPLNADEPPLPLTTDITPPLELVGNDVAIAEWARLLPMLQQARVITDGDRGSLLALCQQWARYLEANNKIALAGMVVRAPSGYPMPNPYIAISNKALGNCIKLWVELGLTPSARTRVATTPGATGAGFAVAFAEFDDPVPTH